MCDIKRCRRTDVAVLYAAKDLRGMSEDSKCCAQDDNRDAIDICDRCWDLHGNKPAHKILALAKKFREDEG